MVTPGRTIRVRLEGAPGDIAALADRITGLPGMRTARRTGPYPNRGDSRGRLYLELAPADL